MRKDGESSDVLKLPVRLNFTSDKKSKAAVWALKLYHQTGYKRRIHIRRLHYNALLQEDLKLPSGKPYRNTVEDFEFLKAAFEQARLLGLIPYDIFLENSFYSKLYVSFAGGAGGRKKGWQMMLKRTLELACKMHIKKVLADLVPVHIELWLERTDSGDIVEKLADKYNLNVVASRSDISITSIWHFIRRINSADKPVRILHISDWTGSKETSDAAEKIESVLMQYGLLGKIDLEVIKLSLTEEECVRYDLPPEPECRGETVIELHALEAAVPGLLCSVLERYLNHFINYNCIKEAEERACNAIKRLKTIVAENSDIYDVIGEIYSEYSGN